MFVEASLYISWHEVELASSSLHILLRAIENAMHIRLIYHQYGRRRDSKIQLTARIHPREEKEKVFECLPLIWRRMIRISIGKDQPHTIFNEFGN